MRETLNAQALDGLMPILDELYSGRVKCCGKRLTLTKGPSPPHKLNLPPRPAAVEL